MIHALAARLLLAEIGDNFPQSGKRLNWSDLWAWGIAAVVAAIVAFIVVQSRKRNDMEERCDNPWKLFRELCRVHNLDSSSKRLLQELVAARGFQQPAQVFLTPSAFEGADLPSALKARSESLQKLRSKLFW